MGIVVGALVDYGLQVAVNFAEGETDILEAFTDVDVEQIVVSGAAGGLSGGLSVLSKAKTGSKLVKLATSELGEATIDATASVTHQLAGDGDVNLVDTAVDVAVGKTLGKKIETITENKVKSTREFKTLAKRMDRARRVASGPSPRASRLRKLEKSKDAVNKNLARRTTATTISSTGAASTTFQQLLDKVINNGDEAEKN